jgi:hypothetical protein
MAEPTRTASGLVKRARRSPEQAAPLPSMPDQALLASLSSVADNLGTRPPVPQRQLPAAGAEPIASPQGPLWSGLGPRPPAPPAAGPPSSRSWPAPPATQRPDGLGGGLTAGGLTRRVRGAQLPTTQPLTVRRTQEHPSGGDGGYRRRDHGAANGYSPTSGHANGQSNGRDGARDRDDGSSAARDVYGFLTSFTKGVQRGLDEARRDPDTPKENS